jgi:hypothetical protein
VLTVSAKVVIVMKQSRLIVLNAIPANEVPRWHRKNIK